MLAKDLIYSKNLKDIKASAVIIHGPESDDADHILVVWKDEAFVSEFSQKGRPKIETLLILS